MRSIPRLLIVFLAAALIPVSGAYAQRGTKSIVPEENAEGHKGDMARAVVKKANERFDKADADKDGLISKDEATSTLPAVAENFAKYDKNNDGKLTWEEFVGNDKWKRDPAK